MPLPALAAASRSIVAKLSQQRAAARVKAMRNVAKKSQELQAKIPPWIKRTQFILDLVKGVSFVITLFTGGLDILSAVTFFVTANGELFLLPQIIPKWPRKGWRTAAIIIMDFILLMVISLTITLIILAKEKPNEFCKFFGEATGNLILWSLGKLGACELVGDVLEWVAK